MPKYKITFQLNCGVSFIDPPTFDSILAYAYFRENYVCNGTNFTTKSIEKVIDFSPMPINSHSDGYFLASQVMYNTSAAKENVQHWRKRWDVKHDHLADFCNQRRKIDSQRGEFKSYDTLIRIVSVPEVWFVFKSDNISEVERLISKHIFAIGKKRAYGNGEITGFGIEQSDEPIIRQIPIREGLSGRVKFCTWRPPYWDTQYACPCIVCNVDTL